ncbi:MAG TPA: penicillin-binding protein 1C [Bacteroidia bacterium]|jgi:penicillin-binding protein 1C|nr:penicillin-binding protein 1C [Bacteroidia bacterium]
MFCRIHEVYTKYRYLLWCIRIPVFIWFMLCLPRVPFHPPASTVLLDRMGNLLGAQISDDGQWRFPAGKKVPDKFRVCILQFEDRDYYSHHGVSFKALGRALVQNVRAHKVVSGGSTITMQVVRLYRKNRRRTLYEKAVEFGMALRLEMRYTKDDILRMYASNAPFGSNVVGLDAASWRYFGRSAEKLSWAESATLAVLPNAPGLIYPGRNHVRLLHKRNRLLARLRETGILDEASYHLALTEPLPGKPLDLPHLAPHLLNRSVAEGHQGQILHSTLDPSLQKRTIQVVQTHHRDLLSNKISNAAVLVLSVKTGEVLAYVGNTEKDTVNAGNDVDVIQAARSTGSILKPLLYAEMLNDGKLMPRMLIPDIPTQIGSYAPKNFSQAYDGAVPANRALSRSLNIPAVRMLQEYGVEKFHRQLQALGLTTLQKPASYYGLSLILGGAEARLWDLASVYAMMGRTLNEYPHYKTNLRQTPHYLYGQEKKQNAGDTVPLLSPSSIWCTFEAMVEVNRPDDEANWRSFANAGKIAWKTGTSFGFRDAWAIGVNPDYVVAVWVGNADGEGRPGLTGISAAAPLLFDVFALLPAGEWFRKPMKDMTRIPVCALSGHRASEYCKRIDSTEVPNSSLLTLACPYHQLIHLDPSGKWRVDSDCEDVNRMKHEVFFVLPPVVEKYYRFNNPNYRTLPEYRADCKHKTSGNMMAVIYPKKSSRICVPVQIDGTTGKTVFEATHRTKSATIYWHLDDVFVAETTDIHQVELNPAIGKHVLTLVDENGNTISQNFEVIDRE